MLVLFYCICIVLAFEEPAVEERLFFDVVRNDKVVGYLEATRVEDGDRIIYTNHSVVNTTLVAKVELVYDTRVVFIDDQMETAVVTTKVNGEVRSIKTTKRYGNGYRFDKNGKNLATVEGPIAFSAIRMLFEQPNEARVVYSEEKGCMHKIQECSRMCYKKINGKGKYSTYHYSADGLKRLTIDAGIFEIEMINR